MITKVSDIRRILHRLRDILPKKYRKEFKEKLYEIEHNENLSEAEKEVLIIKKNIVFIIVMILITME